MPYTITEEKVYTHAPDVVRNAVRTSVERLEGKIVPETAEQGQIRAQFDKKIGGKILGDRTCLEVDCKRSSPTETRLSVTAYPLDAIGRKLMFGARKGVTRTLLNWFYAHMDHAMSEQQ